jgi:hypothetical protein
MDYRHSNEYTYCSIHFVYKNNNPYVIGYDSKLRGTQLGPTFQGAIEFVPYSDPLKNHLSLFLDASTTRGTQFLHVYLTCFWLYGSQILVQNLFPPEHEFSSLKSHHRVWQRFAQHLHLCNVLEHLLFMGRSRHTYIHRHNCAWAQHFGVTYMTGK